MNRDDIAALYAESDQRIGEAPAQRANLAEGIFLNAAFVIFVKERRLVAQIRMAVEAIERHIIVRGDLPAMACTGVRDILRVMDSLFAKANKSHD